MFHGIINRGKGWFRALTALELHKTDEVLEEFEGGPYWPAFLEHFFPGRYRVEVRKINSKWGNGTTSEDPTANIFVGAQEVLRWSNATDQYKLRIKDARKGKGRSDTWLGELEKIGLIVLNSKKMSKRLTELVRLSCAALYDADQSIKVEVIDHIAMGYVDSDVDGISAISQSLAVKCLLANPIASEDWIYNKVNSIYSGDTVVVQIRMLTPKGLIKGNALVLPDEMMCGYDVRTFGPNVKDELRTTGWQWLTIEPSYSIIPVKSDDLTHAIYQDVKGLYTGDDLMSTLNATLEQSYEDLVSGKRSSWMTALVNNADITTKSDSDNDEDEFRASTSSLQLVQNTISKLDKLGIPFESTQSLRFLTINGIKTQFLGDSKEVGSVWRNKNKHWFPVSWAYAAHIMTQEVLEIFGFKVTKGPWGYYHEQTHCFVVPGSFFAENLVNHGGPDLDDTVKVHVRLVKFEDKTRLMAFILRNPNDFGEWSMIPVRKYGPVFHNYGEFPPTVDYAELTTKVPQMSTLLNAGLVTPGQLPGMAGLRIGKEFSLVDENRTRSTAVVFPGGVGASVLPKILWYAMMKTYIANPVASNEDIIDALQQGLATPLDVNLIKSWSEQLFRDVLKTNGYNGTDMDMFWMVTRLPKRFANGIQSSTIENSPWCQLHIQREMAVRIAFEKMKDYLNQTLVMPEVLESINFTEDELTLARTEHDKLTIKRISLTAEEWVKYCCDLFTRIDENPDKGVEYMNRKILALAYQSIVAKRQFPKSNHDQWLYTFSANSHVQPVDWFIRALRAL